MKICITGGCGYVGWSLIRRLADEAQVTELVVYDNLSRPGIGFFLDPPARLSGMHLINADILDAWSLERAMEGVDVVIHLAAHVVTPFADSAYSPFDQVNNWGTSSVARTIELVSPKARLIYLSTTAVYGSSNRTFACDSEPQPTTPYGLSKLKGEAHLRRLPRGGTDVVVIRAANVFGHNPCIRFDAVINRFVRDAIYLGRVQVEGPGHQSRPFIDVSDLADLICIEVMRESDNSGYRCLNAVSFNATILEAVEALAARIPQLEVGYVNQDYRMMSCRVEPHPKLQNVGLGLEGGIARLAMQLADTYSEVGAQGEAR